MKLLEPLRVKGMLIKNRMVMSPMGVSYCTQDGDVTQRMIDYYARRAETVGLLQLQSIAVKFPEGKPSLWHPRIDEDQYMEGLSRLCRAIKEAGDGVKVSLNLQHAGGQTRREYTGADVVTPSATKDFFYGPTREITIAEIQDLIDRYGEAARRVKEMGFDAVELQFAHGYLVSSFLSPLTNRRQDAYGGSLENRMRFPREILRQVREKVGVDFPIITRINCSDFVAGGQSLEEGKRIAQMCKENGADIISVSGGIRASTDAEADPTMACPQGVWVKYAQDIKKAVDRTPVITVRRINSPEMAEQILRETDIDLIAFGRAFLADPDFAKKVVEGRTDEIVPCIACNQGCYDRLFRQEPVTCLVNPACGREREYQIQKTSHPKKIMVIGGGPAGLEAARIAAERGHQVSIFEKESQLGGQLKMACVAPQKGEVKRLLSYFEKQMEKLSVPIRLRTEVSPSLIRETDPDVVVVATGAKPSVPKIDGIWRENVLSAWEVLRGGKVEGKIVAVIGGGKVGCETAELLTAQGKEVKIVEMLEDIGQDMGPQLRKFTKKRLQKEKIEIWTKAKAVEITGEGIWVESGGERRLIKAEKAVLATGSTPVTDLVDSLIGKGKTTYFVGDCARVGDALDAIHAGSYTGRIL